MIDPLTAAASVTTALVGFTGVGVAWQLHRRVRRIEAHAARLRQQLTVERHDARHDQLTGLLNRRAFFHLGNTLVTDPRRHPAVVVVADLDDFKQINDAFGHMAGDQVLATVAGRLARHTGDGLAARLGGDELVALLTNETREPAEIARTLTESLGAPTRVGGQELRVMVSVGVAPVPSPSAAAGEPLAGLLRQADAAMYRVKHRGRSLTRTICSRSDWSTTVMPPPDIDPHQRDPAAVAPADSYQRADPVWVYRADEWRAGVVETASPHAVTVTYRPPHTRGTGVDTLTAHYLLPRDEVDPLLDQQSN